MSGIRMHLWLLFRTNFLKTVLFNFKMFPFKYAWKLPIVFKGRVNTSGCSGKIAFSEPIHTGMVLVGALPDETCSYPRRYSMKFKVAGSLLIGDNVQIRGGGVFNISQNAVVTIGSSVMINSYCRVWLTNETHIGRNSRLSWECQLFDSNFHYLVDDKGYVRNCKGKVFIGDNVWIGNRVTINKGTVIPNYSIIGAGSFVNRDFSEFGERIIIGGNPAKFIKAGFRRVFNMDNQTKIDKFFINNPDEQMYFADYDDENV